MTSTATAFSGFPPEALEFYRNIAVQQDRAWFETHRADYMEHVIKPAQAFIEELGERLADLAPDIGFDPNHTGRGSFKKIHTDQRFQKGRPPFKTYAEMIFWEGPLKTRKANSVFSVRFSPHALSLSTGLKYFEGKFVHHYREAAASDDHGTELATAIKSATEAGFEIGGAHYKRLPPGVAEDHPNAQWLRHNAIYAHRDEPIPGDFHTADLLDHCVDAFEATLSLHRWCVGTLASAPW